MTEGLKLFISHQVISSKMHVQCYALSDVHADAVQNQNWLIENCEKNKTDTETYTVFILAGDVGSEMRALEATFSLLTSKFDAVCFVPGNHELWKVGSANRTPNRSTRDSIEKLQEVLACARAHNVHIGPLRVCANAAAVTIIPLYSWYHSSWDKEPDLVNQYYLESESTVPFWKKWSDFRMCEWPSSVISQEDFRNTSKGYRNTSLANAFAALNEPFLTPEIMPPAPPSLSSPAMTLDHGTDVSHQSQLPASRSASTLVQEGDTVLSFSHFLPRVECSLEKRYSMEPMLSRVSGSDPLEAQIRRLKPHVHIFGHTHIPLDIELDGIRYIQWPLGYFR